jgi:hypothetical protein
MKYIFSLLSIILLITGCNEKDEIQENKKIEVPTINSLESLKRFLVLGEGNYIPKDLIFYYSPKLSKLRPTVVDFDKKYNSPVDWNNVTKLSQHHNHIIYTSNNKNNNIKIYDKDSIIMTGDGDDIIEDTNGNNIIFSGRGNDTIITTERSILIFEKEWGHDKVNIPFSRPVNTSTILDYQGDYPYKFNSFIVFGKDIKREDVFWDENTLRNIKTGDTIELSSRNFNILFSSETNNNYKDTNFIPNIIKPIVLEKLNPSNITEEDDIAYYSMLRNGLYIVDVKDLKNPKLLSNVSFPGEVFNVKIYKNIAIVCQAGEYGGNNLGWISFLDITNPSKPRIIKNYPLTSSVKEIKIKDSILYSILQPGNKYMDVKKLVKFNLEDPNNPEFIKDYDLKYDHSMTFDIHNSILYTTAINKSLLLYDMSNPEKLKFIKEIKTKSPAINEIRIIEDKLFLSYYSNKVNYSIYNLDKKGNLEHIYTQEAKLGDNKSVFIKDDFLYQALGKKGVSVTDLKSNKLIKLIPFENFWVYKIFIIGDTLIAFNNNYRNGGSRFFNLNDLNKLGEIKEEDFIQTEMDKLLKKQNLFNKERKDNE